MLELKAKTYKYPVNIDSGICSKFKHPLIFYIAHKDDSRVFFLTFAVLDFSKKEFSFILSYFPENITKVENDINSASFKIENPSSNPHCSIQIKEGESFLAFVERVRYFYYVDYKRDMIKVYLGEDLGIASGEAVIEFGCTFYKDEKDENYFYFTALSKNESSGERTLHFYRIRLDLAEIEEIYFMPSPSYSAPHVTRKLGNFLLNSEFLSRKVKNNITGKIFSNEKEYMDYVYSDLYKEYCNFNQIGYTAELFKKNNEINSKNVKLDPDFEMFCQSRGCNFLELCEKNEKYSFSVMPGTIMLFDLESKEKQYFETTFPAPAHFEIDGETGIVYTSSHNFIFFDRLYFLGPAAIDKFILKEGKLEKIGTFADAKAYRLTTHKIFRYGNKTYFCSFGHPNRLYFVDAGTMEIVYYDDIGEDIISSQDDMKAFLNEGTLGPAPLTFSVSDDGQYIFLLGNDYIYFYSFPERKIVQKIDYHPEELLLGQNLSLKQFYKCTTHIDYLK